MLLGFIPNKLRSYKYGSRQNAYLNVPTYRTRIALSRFKLQSMKSLS
jgi:hypothetical protein